jgi:hypothetical protein
MGVIDHVGNQADRAEISPPDMRIARRECPRRIVRVFDHDGKGRDQGI